jgi:hypothetical protein
MIPGSPRERRSIVAYDGNAHRHTTNHMHLVTLRCICIFTTTFLFFSFSLSLFRLSLLSLSSSSSQTGTARYSVRSFTRCFSRHAGRTGQLLTPFFFSLSLARRSTGHSFLASSSRYLAAFRGRKAARGGCKTLLVVVFGRDTTFLFWVLLFFSSFFFFFFQKAWPPTHFLGLGRMVFSLGWGWVMSMDGRSTCRFTR